jgi:hypothetical protein
MRRKQRENESENEDFCPPADRVFLNVVKKCIEECGGSRGRMRMRRRIFARRQTGYF